MPYNLDTESTVYFYEQEFYVLSNFSAFRLHWRNLDFDTSEAAYQWEKFAHEPERFTLMHAGIQEAIRRARSAHEAFKIAEANAPHVRANWAVCKVGVMEDILWAKVQQHEYVRRKLLETGERELIENSWRDGFWGWGPDQHGQNVLGNLWVEIRDKLRRSATGR